MHSSNIMLIACLTILIYMNKQQVLTDMYLTNSKLTIYPFKNVYIFNVGNSTSNDAICHGINAADCSIAVVAMGIGEIQDGILELNISGAYLHYGFHLIKQHGYH